jgi:hypothetical protein
MSQIALGYSLNYKDFTTCIVLLVQASNAKRVSDSFYEIVLKPRILNESNKPQYIKEHKIVIDKYSIRGGADKRWIVIVDNVDEQDLTYGHSLDSSCDCL